MAVITTFQEPAKDIFAFLNASPHLFIGSKLPAALAVRFNVSESAFSLLLHQYREGARYGYN
ncbi:hypothetical protein [Flavobacterium rhizosphaerae]|uniref:Uncharacterized protein n=1 Tax=Flavobacterium rhizosphaerae TaxID=3163298 RepID=A0ABW8YXR4_9FLAO